MQAARLEKCAVCSTAMPFARERLYSVLSVIIRQRMHLADSFDFLLSVHILLWLIAISDLLLHNMAGKHQLHTNEGTCHPSTC